MKAKAERTEHITARIPISLKTALDRRAKMLHLKRNEAIRLAIAFFILDPVPNTQPPTEVKPCTE